MTKLIKSYCTQNEGDCENCSLVNDGYDCLGNKLGIITLIDRLEQALKDAGFNVSIWQGRRIYFNGEGRDIAAYIEFDGPVDPARPETPLLSGCDLKVFSNSETQGLAWRINRAKQVKHDLMLRIFAAKISDVKPCERWRDVILHD